MDLDNLVLMIPHARRLGLTLVTTSEEAEGVSASMIVEMPYNPELEILPDTGLMANGAITAFLDTALGGMVSAQFDTMQRIATLDLRVDYFEKPTPYSPVRAKTRCLKVTDALVFVQADAYSGEEEQPFAHAVAAFSHIPFDFPEEAHASPDRRDGVGQIS